MKLPYLVLPFCLRHASQNYFVGLMVKDTVLNFTLQGRIMHRTIPGVNCPPKLKSKYK